MIETKQFYDDLASYYHLIFENWEASMACQGDVLAHLIREALPRSPASATRILDAACGIGTQTLPLAARGFHLVARDLSTAAITRLKKEAEARQLVVDAEEADMRQVGSTVSGEFEVVLAFDNSVPHLLSDDDLRAAFRQFLGVLRPGGVFLCSVRDYDKVERGLAVTHTYGPRQLRGETFLLRQEWLWDGLMHYQATFIIDRETPTGMARELSTITRFYAVSVGRLLELLTEVGFRDCCRIDETIYQPILMGRRAAT
jgi:SAM-dependent methyltransferase